VQHVAVEGVQLDLRCGKVTPASEIG
jgi:hypothetical protein